MTLAFTEQPQAKGHLYISIFGGGVMHTVPAYRETPERFTEEVRLYLVRVSHRGQDFLPLLDSLSLRHSNWFIYMDFCYTIPTENQIKKSIHVLQKYS